MTYEAIAKVIHARRRTQQRARHRPEEVPDMAKKIPVFVYLSWDEMCEVYREDLIAEVMLVIDLEDV